MARKILLFILLNNGEDDVWSKDYTEVDQSSHIIAHLMLVRTKFFREKTTLWCYNDTTAKLLWHVS